VVRVVGVMWELGVGWGCYRGSWWMQRVVSGALDGTGGGGSGWLCLFMDSGTDSPGLSWKKPQNTFVFYASHGVLFWLSDHNKYYSYMILHFIWPDNKYKIPTEIQNNHNTIQYNNKICNPHIVSEKQNRRRGQSPNGQRMLIETV